MVVHLSSAWNLFSPFPYHWNWVWLEARWHSVRGIPRYCFTCHTDTVTCAHTCLAGETDYDVEAGHHYTDGHPPNNIHWHDPTKWVLAIHLWICDMSVVDCIEQNNPILSISSLFLTGRSKTSPYSQNKFTIKAVSYIHCRAPISEVLIPSQFSPSHEIINLISYD